MSRDELNGDHSFKKWFQIMNENGYIWRFCVAFVITLYFIIRLDWVIEAIQENYNDEGMFGAIAVCVVICIPLVICILIAYLGFYKFWRELTGKD